MSDAPLSVYGQPVVQGQSAGWPPKETRVPHYLILKVYDEEVTHDLIKSAFEEGASLFLRTVEHEIDAVILAHAPNLGDLND